MIYELAVGCVVLFIYYYVYFVQRPYLYFKSELITRFFERCVSPTNTVWSTPFLLLRAYSGILHTLFGATFRGAESPLAEQMLDQHQSVKNDIALDWVFAATAASSPQGLLVVVNHGYGGALVQGFIRDTAGIARTRNLHTVVVTVAGVESLSLNWNSALQAAIDRIEQHVGPHLPKILLACSLGGIPAVKFATQNPATFQAIALVSVPLDEVAKSSLLGRSNVAGNLMLATAKRVVKDHADVATARWPDLVSRAMDSHSLADFHHKFIGVAFDQSEVNLINIIDQVACPTILFYALDDPLVDFESIDLIKLIRKPEIATVVTEQGGHCGFFQGLVKPRRWVPDYALDFLTAAVAAPCL